MLVSIREIKVNSGRRNTEPESVKALAKSISEVGLLNPITITADNTLIAGRHRLEAAKLLGWTEIECTVCDVSGLQAELAEIDENFVRVNLSPIEFVCFCGHLYFPSRSSRFHTSCGVMAPQGISLYEHRNGESIAAQGCGKAGRMV